MTPLAKTALIAGVLIFLSSVFINPYDVQVYYEITRNEYYPGGVMNGTEFRILYGAIAFVLLYFYRSMLRTLPKILVLIFVICCFSAVWSIDSSRTISRCLDLLMCGTFALTALRWLGPVGAIRTIFWVGFGLMVVSAAIAVTGSSYAVMGGEISGTWRGLFTHKNVFAPFCATIMIVAALAIELGAISKRTGVAAIGLGLICVLKAESTTAFVCLAGACAMAVASWASTIAGKQRLTVWILSAVVILPFTLAAVSFIPAALESAGRDVTLTGRTNLWEGIIPLTFQNPVGYGYGTNGGYYVQEAMRQASGWAGAKSTHSAYFALAVDVGWFPVALYALWILSLFFRYAHSREARPYLFAAAALGAYVGVNGITEAAAGFYPGLQLFILLLLSAVLSRRFSFEQVVAGRPKLTPSISRAAQ